MDIPRALRTAKLVLHRYDGQQGPGIGQVCQSAASLIADVHFRFNNQEGDEFLAERLADPSVNAEILTVWVARYSDNLTRGDDTGSDQDRLRAKRSRSTEIASPRSPTSSLASTPSTTWLNRANGLLMCSRAPGR
jgi:hypothetical protein